MMNCRLFSPKGSMMCQVTLLLNVAVMLVSLIAELWLRILFFLVFIICSLYTHEKLSSLFNIVHHTREEKSRRDAYSLSTCGQSKKRRHIAVAISVSCLSSTSLAPWRGRNSRSLIGGGTGRSKGMLCAPRRRTLPRENCTIPVDCTTR